MHAQRCKWEGHCVRQSHAGRMGSHGCPSLPPPKWPANRPLTVQHVAPVLLAFWIETIHNKVEIKSNIPMLSRGLWISLPSSVLVPNRTATCWLLSYENLSFDDPTDRVREFERRILLWSQFRILYQEKWTGLQIGMCGKWVIPVVWQVENIEDYCFGK